MRIDPSECHEFPMHCPHCGRLNDVHGGHEEPPTVGALSVCFGCEGVSVFETGPFGLTVRPATPAEMAEGIGLDAAVAGIRQAKLWGVAP